MPQDIPEEHNASELVESRHIRHLNKEKLDDLNWTSLGMNLFQDMSIVFISSVAGFRHNFISCHISCLLHMYHYAVID